MAVMAAGSLLSSLSNAVCMVSLLLKSSCLCHLNPRKKIMHFLSQKIRNFTHSDNWLFFGITDA